MFKSGRVFFNNEIANSVKLENSDMTEYLGDTTIFLAHFAWHVFHVPTIIGSSSQISVRKFWICLLDTIQVIGIADGVGGGGCQIFREKTLRRCNVQCY